MTYGEIRVNLKEDLIGDLLSQSFLLTLQEIDSSVYKNYAPMDIDEVVPLEKITLLFNYQDFGILELLV